MIESCWYAPLQLRFTAETWRSHEGGDQKLSASRIRLLRQMNRPAAILGSALFLVVAPGTLAVYLPWMITRWRELPPFLNTPLTHFLGVFFVAAGVPVLMECFLRFALRGRGTPAPIAPPLHLVVSGLYRYVRNPMYVAVVSVILGQALWFGSRPLLLYAVFIWLMFHVWVMVYEEPALRASFPKEFQEYCASVCRWLPRLRPWSSSSNVLVSDEEK
jgi:protein-S-isoprenylcysteine O-methyltransferase Ste14